MPIEGIHFVGNGSVNLVYAAHIGGRKVVVRLADARYRPKEHVVEAWCIQRAAAVGVPGPQPIAVGTREDTVWMVQEFVEGLRGDAGSIDQIEIWRTLGEYARRIHAIDASDFPERSNRDPQWVEKEWERFVAYGLASLTPDDPLIALGVYRADQQQAIRSVFLRVQGRSYRFGLTHGDLSVWNTIVSPDGRIFLFDWGCASVDILPYREIASILRWFTPGDARFQAFLSGYGLSPDAFAALLPEYADYQLLKSFDLVRWSLDRRRDQIDNYVANARDKMAQSRLA
jgi:aminoglycoside phosphotransferase (APT) family kinase protein